MSGVFITFEGLDGSGKTTQLRMLENELKGRALSVVTTCEPGGTQLGKQLRKLILDDYTHPVPLAELLLFAADRAQHVETLIRPALAKGQIVISDRYADATLAYQGAGRGFSLEIIEQLVAFATNGLQPDLTLFFDLPVEESLTRTAKRASLGAEKNRLDNEAAEFHMRVRAAYLEIARREPQRFFVIDANRSINEVHTRVINLITRFLQ